MKYDFDKIVDRHGTDCYKWDMIAKRKLPADTLPLWVADMDFKTVPEVKERLKEVADRGIYGYSMLGDGYYHALKNWFSERFGWQVEKDWVIVTPGVVFALAAAVRAYTKEGDSVMIQRPVYHPFTNVVKENGRKLVNNPLVMENGKYHMDYEDMNVFTYVENLMAGRETGGFRISQFARRHDQIDATLTELKNIIIKYYPAKGNNHLLNAVLFDIFSCEQDLASHCRVEDYLFVPAVLRLEKEGK